MHSSRHEPREEHDDERHEDRAPPNSSACELLQMETGANSVTALVTPSTPYPLDHIASSGSNGLFWVANVMRGGMLEIWFCAAASRQYSAPETSATRAG